MGRRIQSHTPVRVEFGPHMELMVNGSVLTAGFIDALSRKKKLRLLLWEKHRGRCHWCGAKTILDLNLPDKRAKGWTCPREATIEHVHSRLQPEERRRLQLLVLACWTCNQKRSFEECRSLPRYKEQLNAIKSLLKKTAENG